MILFPPQISYAAALSSLSDRSRFKSYFRTTPTFNNYAPAIVSLLNKFNWKRVAIITQAENLFIKVCVNIEQTRVPISFIAHQSQSNNLPQLTKECGRVVFVVGVHYASTCLV